MATVTIASFGSCCRFADGFCVDEVIFVTRDKRFYMLWGDQLWLIAQGSNLPGNQRAPPQDSIATW